MINFSPIKLIISKKKIDLQTYNEFTIKVIRILTVNSYNLINMFVTDFEIPQKVYSFFTSIPYQSWDLIVRNEPEWIGMKHFHDNYPFGSFAVLMVMCGLNDFQLKGRAEIAYWPVIRKILINYQMPKTLEEMVNILLPFYENERYTKMKSNRLLKFMESKLAFQLWNSSPAEIEKTFTSIWRDLADVMGQQANKKTIVFAMKCLGIALLMEHKTNFNFESIPVPVDIRVRKITEDLGGPIQSDDIIREYWHQIIQKIRLKDPTVTMIHLDSFLWQIAGCSGSEINEWFCNHNLCYLTDTFKDITFR